MKILFTIYPQVFLRLQSTMRDHCYQLEQKMLIKILMHSSLACRLSTSALRVRQYSFRPEYSQSSPNISFFMTSLKLSRDLLKFSRWILRQTMSITLLISAKGLSVASFMRRRATKSTCSLLSADCQTKMLQNRMKEVRVKLPLAIRVSISIRTSSGSSLRMMFWKNSSFSRQLTKVSLSCMGQLKMQSLGFILRYSCWNFLERQAMRDSCSTIWAACTLSPVGSYSTCRYSPKQRSRLLRSSTRTTCFTDSLSMGARLTVFISPSELDGISPLELRCWSGEIHFFLRQGTGSETVGLQVLVFMMASMRF